MSKPAGRWSTTSREAKPDENRETKRTKRSASIPIAKPPHLFVHSLRFLQLIHTLPLSIEQTASPLGLDLS